MSRDELCTCEEEQICNYECANNRIINWKVEIISELDVKEGGILFGIK